MKRETPSQEVLMSYLDDLIKLEGMAIERYRATAYETSDGEVRDMCMQIAEMHEHCVKELYTRMDEIRSRSKITLQINEMFL